MKWVCAKCNPSCHLTVGEDIPPTDCTYRQSFVNSGQDSTPDWKKGKTTSKKKPAKKHTPAKRAPAQREGNTIAGFHLL